MNSVPFLTLPDALPVRPAFRLYPAPVRVEDVFLPDPAVSRASEAYGGDHDEGVDPPDRDH